MFTTLLENPMPTIVIGILLVAILGAILIRTGAEFCSGPSSA